AKHGTWKGGGDAAGTWPTHKPMPAAAAWRTEMPITPRDTERIVAPARSTNFSPRSDSTWRENALTAPTNDGPGENRNPATITEIKKLSRPVPAPAATTTRLPP